MNQHTPQEWADITGCYVVRDQLHEKFELFNDRPEINYEEGFWSQTGDWGELPHKAVPEKFYYQDWTILYEPRKQDSAPHQSEVFIHKEYATVLGFDIDELNAKISRLMNEGWKPIGNAGYTEELISGFAHWHQAMVRGV